MSNPHTLRTFLADPLWQGIGVAVAAVALLFSIYGWIAQTGELGVTGVGLTPLRYAIPGATVQIKPDGTDLTLSDGTIEYVLIKNNGSRAIRPSDFTSPITIRKGGREVAAVLSCANAVFINDQKIDVVLRWQKTGDAWVAENVLFNAADLACVSIVYAETFFDPTQLNKFVVEARIADVRLVHYRTFSEFSRTDTDFLFYFVVNLSGKEVYAFLACLVLLTFISISLLDAVRIDQRPSARFSVLATVLITFAVATSESLVHLMLAPDLRYVHPVVWPILVLFIGTLIALTYLAFRKRRNERLAGAP